MRDSPFENISKFYEDDTIDHGKELPRNFSSLYLLIRDAKVCLKLDPSHKEDYPLCTYGAEWPALMTIFSGIDLMGKFLAGCDSRRNGAVGIRFKDFIKEYFDDIKNEREADKKADIIFDLRNALAHSFNLYSKNCIFTLINQPTRPLILDEEKDNIKYARINVYKLFKNFQSGCEKYHEDLLEPKNESLRKKFNKMYPKYGTTNMFKI